jgi:hypothetical protein
MSTVIILFGEMGCGKTYFLRSPSIAQKKDNLVSAIKEKLTLKGLSERLSISIPTVLSKIKYLLGFKGLTEARKHLCENNNDGLGTSSS